MTDPKKTVFLVDDDEDFLLQMQVQLEARGYAVTTADTQASAEKLLSELTPDVAILDLMMENFDAGFILAHHIKRRFPNVPVIMVTGVARETGMSFDPSSDAQRAWVKADVVLPKPVRFEQLERELDRLLLQ